ncbi:hypothetical protein ACFVVM_31190 [Nocardia sp. NPDC058176]|uniref:hypothetical protein n=1 Tax=Nocardia sp. NPDC058176 TaxID=3346368 RepID=UPI0036DC24AF
MHPVSPEQRQQMLNMAVNSEVARGAQVLEMNQTSAVLSEVDAINHVLHLMITVFTCGFWVLVWLLVAATARPRSFRLTVDEFGIVQRSSSPKLVTAGGWEPHDGLWWRRPTDRR